MSNILNVNKLMTVKELIKIKGDVKDLIRLGPKHDSGYVVNNEAVIKSDILYTYGVGGNYEFEEHYSNLFKNKIIRMFDPTIGMLNISNPNIKFYIDGLYGRSENNTSFQDHIINYNDIDKNIFLKIDTEGAEYKFFKCINLKILENVVGMIVEFHELYNQYMMNDFKYVITKLLENYDITHVHGNNHTPLLELNNNFRFPSTPEITFLRKDLNTSKEFSERNFPLQNLDYPNAINLNDYSFVLYK